MSTGSIVLGLMRSLMEVLMRKPAPLLAALMLLLAPSLATAQGSDEILIDLQREWTAAQQSDADGLTPLQRAATSTFELRQLGVSPNCQTVAGAYACGEVTVGVPLTFNSNPLGVPQQTDDGLIRPGFSLFGSLKFDDFPKVVGVVGADMSFPRYFRYSRQDRDIYKFWLGGAFTPSPALSLYAGYRPTLAFTDGFEVLKTSFHDAVGSVRLSPRTAIAALKLSIEASLTYRSADRSVDSGLIPAAQASVTYSHYPDPSKDLADWSIMARPTVTFYWFDEEINGRERHDVRVGVTVTGKWYPWHASSNLVLRGTSLGLQVAVARNHSTLESRTFTVWDIGPVLTVVYGKADGKPPTRFRSLGRLD